jgi:hypothetical protein
MAATPLETAPESPERVSCVSVPRYTEAWIEMKVREFYRTPEGKAELRRNEEERQLVEAGFPPKLRGKKRAAAVEALRRERVRRKGQRQAHVKRLHSRRLRQAMPPWADREAMQAVYAEAQRLTEETGEPHEVDHVIPLLGREVSGLHVEYNLRVVRRTLNRRKSNRLVAASENRSA